MQHNNCSSFVTFLMVTGCSLDIEQYCIIPWTRDLTLTTPAGLNVQISHHHLEIQPVSKHIRTCTWFREWKGRVSWNWEAARNILYFHLLAPWLPFRASTKAGTGVRRLALSNMIRWSQYYYYRALKALRFLEFNRGKLGNQRAIVGTKEGTR